MEFEIKAKQNLDFKTARYKETFPNIFTNSFYCLKIYIANARWEVEPNKITDGKIIISGLRELQ